MNFTSIFRRVLKKRRKIYFITNKKELNFLDTELSKNKIFALDTEFDWRTTYFPKLSLIQISLDQNLFLIDCLKVNPKIILKKYLENKNILKIFHSVRSDTTVLSKCLGCITNNVFDIQVADKILSNTEIQAYGKIVKKFFNISLKKTETNSNWLKRPLSDSQIKYALDDVDYLIEIYGYQKNILKKVGLLKKVLSISANEASLGNESLKKLRLKKKEKKMSERNKEIFLWREEVAETENVPPTFIFKEKFLQKLSKIKSEDSQARIKVMTIIGDTELTNKFIKIFL